MSEQRKERVHIRLPHSVGQSSVFTPAAKLIYAVMLAYAGKSGLCFASYQRIATRIGLDVSSVKRAIRQLERKEDANPAGVIERVNPDKVEGDERFTLSGGFRNGRTNVWRCLVLVDTKPKAGKLVSMPRNAKGAN